MTKIKINKAEAAALGVKLAAVRAALADVAEARRELYRVLNEARTNLKAKMGSYTQACKEARTVAFAVNDRISHKAYSKRSVAWLDSAEGEEAQALIDRCEMLIDDLEVNISFDTYEEIEILDLPAPDLEGWASLLSG